jgi:hypothetical protein
VQVAEQEIQLAGRDAAVALTVALQKQIAELQASYSQQVQPAQLPDASPSLSPDVATGTQESYSCVAESTAAGLNQEQEAMVAQLSSEAAGQAAQLLEKQLAEMKEQELARLEQIAGLERALKSADESSAVLEAAKKSEVEAVRQAACDELTEAKAEAARAAAEVHTSSEARLAAEKESFGQRLTASEATWQVQRPPYTHAS